MFAFSRIGSVVLSFSRFSLIVSIHRRQIERKTQTFHKFQIIFYESKSGILDEPEMRKSVKGETHLTLICCINNYEKFTSVITLCFVSYLTGDIHEYGLTLYEFKMCI